MNISYDDYWLFPGNLRLIKKMNKIWLIFLNDTYDLPYHDDILN